MTTTQVLATGPVEVRPDRMWRDRAACRSGDAELFFPAAEVGPAYDAQVAAAKAVCGRCRVRTDCAVWALEALPYGIAGGMTEDERRRARAGHRSGRACRGPEPPAGATPAEVAGAGRAAIRAGHAVPEVARAFGVTARTAARWAARTRTTTTDSTSTCAADGARTATEAEGSAGGHRAPLQISHTATQAGTRAEGTRA